MRTHMCLKVAGIPQFAHQLTESLDQADHDVARRHLYVWVVFFPEKIASYLWYADQSLQYHIRIVVCLYVVETDNARQIDCAIICPGHFSIAVQHFYLLFCKRRIQHILWKNINSIQNFNFNYLLLSTHFNVVQRRVDHLIVVRQAVELESAQVDKHMMTHLNAVCVAVGLDPSALEVFAAHETRVDIVVG